MSINNSPALNNNVGLSEFRFWCQKVLPLVYDDSLSYYETLCKIANKLNEAITSANTSQDNIVLLKQAYDELLEYINEYTKTLDATVVEKVNDALDNMVQSGELFDYVISRITLSDIGAAPAGYGLGTVAKNIAQDLDTVVENGWYSYNKNACTHTPENLESMLLVENFSNQNYCKQTVTTIIGVTYIRLRYDGTWYDWRCVNPPMNLGVEYSTTEQWQGKTVYTKLVDCGNLPNNTQKNVTFTNVSTKVLRCYGQVSDGSSFPFFVGGNRIDVMGHLNQISISTNYDSSAYTGTVQVWYLKD